MFNIKSNTSFFKNNYILDPKIQCSIFKDDCEIYAKLFTLNDTRALKLHLTFS